MFRLIKNIFNAFIIVLVVLGLNSLYTNHFFDDIIGNVSKFITEQTAKTVNSVGDFSEINPEFHVDTAMNLFGYKAVIAEHKASNQRMIVLDTGKKTLLSKEDFNSGEIDKKLEDLSKKFKYQSSNVSDIEVLSRGYIYAYGKSLPYVKFKARVTKLPINQVMGIIALNDSKSTQNRILLSVNEKNRYSHLITTEFYRAVRESK